MKTAVLFAGQGAQFVGMGKDLYENFPLAKEYFDKAQDVLKTPIKSICFDGPEDKLKMTENTQPAILLMSYVCYKLLEEKGIKFDAYAGFSLGEYSALTSAGVIKFEDGLKIVRERGLIMDKAVTGLSGGMAAIIGLEDEKVEEICKAAGGVVVPANYNCPGQLVISGEKSAVDKACKLAEEAGAKKVVVLNVSGPFHSPLLQNASKDLENTLNKFDFSKLGEKKIVSNVTASFHTEGDVKNLLVKQMYSPVKWRTTIESLISNGYTKFVEVGPGKVLSGFMRSINRDMVSLSVGSLDTFNKSIESLS
ncbi:MAG TPA: ACP S-malonyltransferase [Spirochaetota bacterium]|nr:ACP S-malonyltransferase [Spirochaetota bacterium]